MPKVSHSDAQLIEQLHALVFQNAETQALIEEGFNRALVQFDEPDYALPYVSYNLPITHFEALLSPEERGRVGLCRVFILKAGCQMPKAEIHRNSIQRLVSYKGNGAIHSSQPGGVDKSFVPCAIQSPLDATTPYTDCWDVVPKNTWHFPFAGEQEDWFTVTFHSASEADIIDEHAEFDS